LSLGFCFALGALSGACSTSKDEISPAGGGGGQGARPAAGRGGQAGMGSRGGQAGQGGVGVGGIGGLGAGGLGGMALSGGEGGHHSGGSAGLSGGAGGAAGTVGTGGTGGTGGTNATGGTGGTSSCPQAVCEDFESLALGAYPNDNPNSAWTTELSGKNTDGLRLEIDDSRASSGTKAAKITVPPGEIVTAMLERRDSALFATEGGFYARMMMYLDGVPSGDRRLHYALMQLSGFHARGEKQGQLRHSIGGQPDRMRNLMLWPYERGRLMDCAKDSDTQIPSKRWACLEWHVDPQANSIEIWLDGTKQVDNSWIGAPEGGKCLRDQLNGVWEVPSVQIMRFGWQHYHHINGMTLWLDDLALDKQRIGCPP